jgi:uncharacterized membrane protein
LSGSNRIKIGYPVYLGLPVINGRPFFQINLKGVCMKNNCAALLLVALMVLTSQVYAADAPKTVSNMGNVKGGDVKAAHSIIDKNCTQCHSKKRIEDALSAKKDMAAIQKEMEKRGAKLNNNESEVLGIYWKSQNPLKKVK